MLDPIFLHNEMKKQGINFYCGVPDSLLSDFSACLQTNEMKHHISPNEGNAVALAAGSYMATGDLPLVYLQNSGQGNTINPLVSLTDPSVYGIPMILLVGWRGEPGRKDEPQHLNQGAVTKGIFDTLGIRNSILPEQPEEIEEYLKKQCDYARIQNQPVAIIVRKGTFSPFALPVADSYEKMSREEAIAEASSALPEETVVVATTGKISRELYSQRKLQGRREANDFLTVGSMGHASQIAMGIALEKPSLQVCCFDGDGAALMHMGGMAVIGTSDLKNYIHIIFNNASHESVGGLPTVGDRVSFTGIATACGYKSVHRIEKPGQLGDILKNPPEGPLFVEVIVSIGSRDDLARPAESPRERLKQFTSYLQEKWNS